MSARTRSSCVSKRSRETTEEHEHARDRLETQDERVRALRGDERLRDERVVEVLAEKAFAKLLGRVLPRLNKEQEPERDARRTDDVSVADFVQKRALHRPSR